MFNVYYVMFNLTLYAQFGCKGTANRGQYKKKSQQSSRLLGFLWSWGLQIPYFILAIGCGGLQIRRNQKGFAFIAIEAN